MTTTTLDRISTDRSGNKTKTKRVLLLKPRGFCAGVVRAIDIVQIALDTFGAPIYVRKEIVHNSYVVTDLAPPGPLFAKAVNYGLSYGQSEYLLLAGGIGITPIYTMVLALLQAGANFRLLYAARRRDDLALDGLRIARSGRIALAVLVAILAAAFAHRKHRRCIGA